MEIVLMAVLFLVFGFYTSRRESRMKEKMFEIYREHRQGKWDHERDWEKYPPPKWVIEMYASKESFDK